VIIAVLDASALIALMLREPGAEKVETILNDSAVSAVNLAEVVGFLARNGAAAPVIRQMIDAVESEVVPFDAELAFAAGLLVPATRAAGLSLGDRACLALARRLGVKALTSDTAWPRIAAAVRVEIELIR
jgi:ribonuclease VapC